MNDFILITPIKNEENYLRDVINSVKNQTILPRHWLIINDGSTDESLQVIKDNIKDLSWAIVIDKSINEFYNWLAISNTLLFGLDYLEMNKLINNDDYLGVLDGDIILEDSYFEKLIIHMNFRKEVAVSSGEIYIKKNNIWQVEYKNSKNPRGGARIYRYTTLKEIGGFPQTPSWDRISDIKLKNRSYSLSVANNAKAYQLRESFGKTNKLKGFFLHGRSRYILNFNLFHIIFISLKLVRYKNFFFVGGFSYFLGYATGFFCKDKRIYDKEIIDYSKSFWKRMLKI